MQKLGALVALLAIGLVTFFLWLNRLPPFDGLPEPTPVAFEDASAEYEAITVSGTARLTAKQMSVRPASLGKAESTWWLYPLFPKGNTSSNAVTVMVLSPVEPDALAGFEDMTLSGWARPPAALMTPQSEHNLRERGYTFEDDYIVLEVFPPADE